MKPMIKLGKSSSCGVKEFRDKIVIGTQYFRSNDLAITDKFNTAGIDTGAIPYKFKTVLPDIAGQIAWGSANSVRTNRGTVSFNPNLDPEFRHVFESEKGDKLLVFDCGSGMRRGIISTDTMSLITADIADKNRVWDTIGTKIGENEYLQIGSQAYYDRCYYGFRTKIDIENSSFRDTHNYKWYQNYAIAGFLYKTTDNVISYHSWGRSFAIGKYNINNSGFGLIKQINFSKNALVIPSQFFKPETDNNKKVFYIAGNNGNKFRVIKISIDSNYYVTTKECTLSNNNNGYLTQFNTNYNSIISWISEDTQNGIYYLNIAVVGSAGDTFNNTYVLYTYKIGGSDNTDLELITYKRFSSKTYGVVFLNEERTQIAIPSVSGLHLLTFQNNDWNDTLIPIKDVASVLYDNEGRLWAISADAELFMFVPQAPVTLVVKPESENVIYNGEPINTKVYVSAYNFSNQRLAITGTLSIKSGNAKFPDGSTRKEITTLADKDLPVDIIITDAGIVDIIFDVNV